jgi:hypothetical protein
MRTKIGLKKQMKWNIEKEIERKNKLRKWYKKKQLKERGPKLDKKNNETNCWGTNWKKKFKKMIKKRAIKKIRINLEKKEMK